MAVTVDVYNSAKKALMDGSGIDWVNDTIKVALCTSTYAPNVDTHDFFDDITNELGTGGGYTAGGITLTTKTATIDTTNDEAEFDAADADWGASTSIGPCRYAIIYKSTGTASTSPLIGYVNFGQDEQSSSGTFKITWAAEGVFKIV